MTATLEHRETSPATELLLKLFKGDIQTRDCPCYKCTAERFHLSNVLQRVERASKALAILSSKLVERPIRPEVDSAILLWRTEQYNATVRCAQTLFSFLPTEFRAKFADGMPEPLSQADVSTEIEHIRTKIGEELARVLEAKSAPLEEVSATAAETLGTTLAEIVNEARKNGASDEQITAVVRNAAGVARDAMRETAEAAAP